MQNKLLLTGLLLLLFQDKTNKLSFPEMQVQRGKISIGLINPNHLKITTLKTTIPFWEPGQQKNSDKDEPSLKQSNWYYGAMSGIEEMEYEINYDEASRSYASPNRKQNLRSFYTADKFTLLPRNDSTDKWKLDLTLQGIYSGNKRIYKPTKNADVIKNGKIIQFNHNNDFTVEYINNKEGVRQNFIVQKEPVGKSQTINIKLQTNNGWLVNKVHDKEIHFAKAKKNGYDKKITYNGLKVWDANNKELEAGFDVANNKLSIIVNTKNAVYPITIDPLSTTAAAIVESKQANAELGWSVASAGDVNGDGYSDVIVGAYSFDNGQTDEGAAFIYHGSVTGISTIPAAMVESNQAGASMGSSVSTAGDVNGDGYSDIIVGANYYSNGNTNEGAAFIYHGSASGINTTAAAIVESNQDLAYMGGSVSTAGDVNGDGYSDVIVGSIQYDNGETDEGAAFIYHGSAGGINTTAAVRLESNQASAFFGRSVASAGDVNGDGYSDVIVGADSFDNGETDEGAAFVYHGSATGINTTAAAMVESNQASASMGISVSSAGDVNSDGYSDVIVGIYAYTNGQNQEGAAAIYHGSASGINTTAVLMLESNQAFAFFGHAVAAAGDVNGDGYSDVIVGASYYDNGQTDEGAAFIYQGSATGINPTSVALLEANQAGALFGNAVAAAGDVNGDGYSDVIAGSNFYSNSATHEGAAFIYHGAPSGLSTIPNDMLDDADQAGAYFGWSVASAGDVNSDGYSDVIIGAFQYDGGNNNEGRAFVYYGSAAGLSPVPNVVLDDANQDLAFFVNSVASAGDVNGDGYGDVIVGAWQYDEPGFGNEGRAYIYHGSSAGLSATPNTILDGVNQAGAHFGISVAGAGDVNGDGYADVIVGAYLYDDGASINEGAAFVYHGSATGLSTVPNSVLDDADQGGAQMGYSVAGAGDVNGDGYSDVIVGANLYDQPGFTNEGRAFVYHGSVAGLGALPAAILDDANQANANFGCSVASAGDVNGDGFSDVVVGANQYDEGANIDEGQAWVYHGSAAGVSTVPNSILDDANKPSSSFGHSVASAGDVNGDGYSDVIVGAIAYDDGFMNEGRAFIYHGSAAGLSAVPNAILDDGNQATALFGNSVAGAGDINGDGFSDVIVGSYFFDDPPYTDEGRAFVYYGNNGGGPPNNLRLYNTDLVTPISHFNTTEPGFFGAGLFTKSALGRVKGKLVWEVKAQGMPFSGNPITNSTAYLSKQSAFFDLGITGVELKNNVTKQGRSNKLRVRVEYDKITAITGQMYGPWRYPAGYLQGANGQGSVPLPITLISFNGQFINADDVQLNWITANEINVQDFVVERSADGINYTAMGTLLATGQGSTRTDYSFIDRNVQHNLIFYRLKINERNGDLSYSNIVSLKRNNIVKGFVSPNPAQQGTNTKLTLFSQTANHAVSIVITGSTGQVVLKFDDVLKKDKNELQVPTNKLSKGIYLVTVFGNEIKETYRLLIQ